jgi:serine protease Do
MIALLTFLGTTAPTAAQPPPPRTRPYLGVLIQPPPPGAQRPGILVVEVTPDSPADKAGVKVGDAITKAGDKNVRSYDDLINILDEHKPGDKLTLRVMRQDKDRDLTVTLGEQPREARPGPGRPGGGRRPAFLGVRAVPLNPADRDRLGVTVDSGVLVQDVMPNSPASRAGLRRDDVITRVDGNAVADPMQLRDAVNRAGVGKEITLTVARGKETKELKAKLAEAPAGRMMPPPGAGG